MTTTTTPTSNGGKTAEVTPQVQRSTFVRPLANISETADGFVVEAELPGVAKSGLEVTVENGELVIVGRRSQAVPAGQQVYRETRPADYRRVFELDPSIDAAKISAHLDSGLLKLVLPKAESVKPRKIEIAG
ncbi:MAG TPA: Hsp20/alpha crystallin family protein [Chthoniobacteraceae bacterium]|jgi:HSP20 family protein|nr:Hsp20/alpha crystallin family protein [Chthoniobacteraceae bacterium]